VIDSGGRATPLPQQRGCFMLRTGCTISSKLRVPIHICVIAIGTSGFSARQVLGLSVSQAGAEGSFMSSGEIEPGQFFVTPRVTWVNFAFLKGWIFRHNSLNLLVHPERFELPAPGIAGRTPTWVRPVQNPLTDTLIRTIAAPASGRVEISDERCPGLTF